MKKKAQVPFNLTLKAELEMTQRMKKEEIKSTCFLEVNYIQCDIVPILYRAVFCISPDCPVSHEI